MQLISASIIIVSFGIASVHPKSHRIGEGNGESENRENFHKLFDSIKNDDIEKTKTFRHVLEHEAIEERQVFDRMKEELQFARQRNAYKRRDFYKENGNTREKAAVFKRAARRTIGASENPENPLNATANLEKPLNASVSPWARKKLPLDVSEIREIFEQDYAYVDKTSFVLQLIRGNRSVLITRPKGFGKTLFISTLEEIFKGNRELFRDTDIYHSDYTWPKYPVYRVDLSQIDSSNVAAFENGFKDHLAQFIESYGVTVNRSENLCEVLYLFENVSMVAGSDIIVLIDEFDAPITNNIQHPRVLKALNTAEDNRQVIALTLKLITRSMYNPKVKFAFVAGVNKIGWVGGAPRYMADIEMDAEYATLMGFTEDELRKCFRNHIRDISRRRSRRNNVTEDDIVNEIRTWYGGYRFSDKEVRVFNPASTLRYLSSRRAENYWYVARNRSFMIDEAAGDNMPLGLRETTVGMRLKPRDFNMTYLNMIDIRTLMYHTGYVTIRDCHPEKKWYDLDFPNKEAQDAYNVTYLLRDRSRDHHKHVEEDVFGEIQIYDT